EQRQFVQLRELLMHCATHVPYYRWLFAEAGIQPAAIQSWDDFRRIPVLTRPVYQARFAEFQAAALPSGTQAAQIAHTSGSTGTPLRVLQTNVVQLWWSAFYLRDLEWCNIQPAGSLASIRATGKTGAELLPFLEGVTYDAWRSSLKPLLIQGPCHGLEVQVDHRKQLQWLRRVDPDYLTSYPSNLEVLARLLQEEGGGKLPRLRVIQGISDPLSPEAQILIEGAFGVPVKNTYSCTEAGYLASPCPQGHGLHVHAENVILEVVDEAGRPCAPGETGTVLLTTLQNFRGPFIRYHLHDEVTLGPTRCPCGRGLPLLTRVDGKQRPMLVLPDGRQKSSYGLTYPMSDIAGYRQYQLIQKSPTHMIVRLVPDSRWTEAQAQRVAKLMDEFFGQPIQLELRLEEAILAPPNGKLRQVICEVA
ncbi:MAG: phenylacetate--CoA ligase family protein, partial [Planctomycetia bacterium]|nr:phenylacetate--CoA ligase family protein [Planctomycetia bacterium]